MLAHWKNRAVRRKLLPCQFLEQYGEVPERSNGPVSKTESEPPEGVGGVGDTSIADLGDRENDRNPAFEALLAAVREYADLAGVVMAWPTLPEVLRARISGIVEGALEH